ncbi:MAG: hypothetical protein ABIY52_04120 [Gemmatimonadaceae bacterium]
MGLPRADLKGVAERNAIANREADRDTRRDFVFTCLRMIGFVAIGYVFVGISAHVTDVALGWIYFWAGVTIWIPGVLFTLLGFYRRGEMRGDW